MDNTQNAFLHLLRAGGSDGHSGHLCQRWEFLTILYIAIYDLDIHYYRSTAAGGRVGVL